MLAAELGLRNWEHAWVSGRLRARVLGWPLSQRIGSRKLGMHVGPEWVGRAPGQHATQPEVQAVETMHSEAQGIVQEKGI